MNRTKNPKYFVCRQHYWHNGVFAVEIARGGSDYASPDMLVNTYKSLGEGNTFFDPREAVKAAIAVAEKWRDTNSKPVKMVFGQNLDLICADPVSITEAKRKFPQIAQRLYEAAVKCDGCGEILKDETYHLIDVPDEREFCSEYCAENAWEQSLEEMEETDE